MPFLRLFAFGLSLLCIHLQNECTFFYVFIFIILNLVFNFSLITLGLKILCVKLGSKKKRVMQHLH